jgi:ribokinase
VSAPELPAEARSTADVCVIGSANLDLVTRVERMPRPGETLLGGEYREFFGGKGLNQAVAASRSGAATVFVGALGDDAAGRDVRQALAVDQIDASLVRTVDAPTGRAVILVSDDGENMIVVAPGANAAVTAPPSLPATKVVLAQLEVPIEAVEATFRLARSMGATTILNPAPAANLPPSLLAVCDIVIPNEHERALLGGVDALRAAGCTVVVTRGGEGVDVHDATGHVHQAPFRVDVVDTTGAGDAFCGSLASRLAAGSSLRDAVRWGAAAGALATTRHGAVPAQPTAAEIESLLNRPG